MARITNARKSERITEVTFESGSATLTFEEDRYDRNNAGSISVKAPDTRAELLDELLVFAQPSESECPPRQVTVESLIAEMQRRREALNETWGTNKGKPRASSTDFSITNEDAGVISAVLGTGEISYAVGDTVRKALSGSTSGGW